jgi:hypothetical protein
MSVTFSAAWDDIPVDHFACCNDSGFIVAQYAIDTGPEVNLSNSNAATILARLGVDFEDYGTMDSEDFEGRCMVATIGHDDSGVDSVTDGNMIHGGLRPGYYESVFERLAEVAAFAVSTGRQVVWS